MANYVPELNYTPIIRPYVEGAHKEYAAAQKDARDQYDAVITGYDIFQEAADNMKSLTPKGDIDQKNKALTLATLSIKKAAERGDYENMGRMLRQATSIFKKEYAPVVQQVEERRKLFEELDKRQDISVERRNKIKEAIDYNYDKQGGLQLDATGQPVNFYTKHNILPEKEVDTPKKIMEIVSKIQDSSVKSVVEGLILDNKSNYYGMLNAVTNFLKSKNRDDVVEAIKDAFSLDKEWQASLKQDIYLDTYSSEKQLQVLGNNTMTDEQLNKEAGFKAQRDINFFVKTGKIKTKAEAEKELLKYTEFYKTQIKQSAFTQEEADRLSLLLPEEKVAYLEKRSKELLMNKSMLGFLDFGKDLSSHVDIETGNNFSPTDLFNLKAVRKQKILNSTTTDIDAPAVDATTKITDLVSDSETTYKIKEQLIVKLAAAKKAGNEKEIKLYEQQIEDADSDLKNIESELDSVYDSTAVTKTIDAFHKAHPDWNKPSLITELKAEIIKRKLNTSGTLDALDKAMDRLAQKFGLEGSIRADVHKLANEVEKAYGTEKEAYVTKAISSTDDDFNDIFSKTVSPLVQDNLIDVYEGLSGNKTLVKPTGTTKTVVQPLKGGNFQASFFDKDGTFLGSKRIGFKGEQRLITNAGRRLVEIAETKKKEPNYGSYDATEVGELFANGYAMIGSKYSKNLKGVSNLAMGKEKEVPLSDGKMVYITRDPDYPSTKQYLVYFKNPDNTKEFLNDKRGEDRSPIGTESIDQIKEFLGAYEYSKMK